MKLDPRLVQLIATRQATAKDLEGVDPAAVIAVKSNPEIVQFGFKASDPIEVDAEKRVLRYVFTDESVDSDGDIIRCSGWDLGRYKANPVILWAHNGHARPPIGKAVAIHFEKGSKPRGLVDIEFAPKEAHAFADEIYQLAKRGFVKATSAGFSVLEASTLTAQERLDMGIGPWGIESKRQKLFEISVCSVPANENALRASMKSLVAEGVVSEATMRELEREYPLTEKDWERRHKEITRSFFDMGRVETETIKMGESSTPSAETLAPLAERNDAAIASALAEVAKAIAANTEASTRAIDAATKLTETNTRLVQAVSDMTRKTATMGGAPGGSQKPEASAPEAQRSQPIVSESAVKAALDEMRTKIGLKS